MTPEESFAAFLTRKPLVRFSVYSHIQAQTLQDLSEEITSLIEGSIKDGKFAEGSNIQLIYGRFWLWVLGAYEVTRTMSEYHTCFSGTLNVRVSRFKSQISMLRMPFAKLQFKGSDKPINGEASIYNIDIDAKDFVFQINDNKFTMRGLMNDFASLVTGIRPEEVLRDLRDANV
jgi:hypothetical protein